MFFAEYWWLGLTSYPGYVTRLTVARRLKCPYQLIVPEDYPLASNNKDQASDLDRIDWLVIFD